MHRFDVDKAFVGVRVAMVVTAIVVFALLLVPLLIAAVVYYPPLGFGMLVIIAIAFVGAIWGGWFA